jgi:hypothetical protein
MRLGLICFGWIQRLDEIVVTLPGDTNGALFMTWIEKVNGGRRVSVTYMPQAFKDVIFQDCLETKLPETYPHE